MPPHITKSTVTATTVTATTARDRRKHFRLANGRSEGMGNVLLARHVGRKSCRDLALISSETRNREVYIATLPAEVDMKNVAWYKRFEFINTSLFKWAIYVTYSCDLIRFIINSRYRIMFISSSVIFQPWAALCIQDPQSTACKVVHGLQLNWFTRWTAHYSRYPSSNQCT